MQYKENIEQPKSHLPDAQHRITLLIIAILLFIPLTVASYFVAVIAILKGNYGVATGLEHQTSQYVGFVVAILITIYLGLHWYVFVRYYRNLTSNIFGLRHFLTLYGLEVINIIVLILSLHFNVLNLPTFMIPIILFCIIGYLIYLRRYVLSGKLLR